MHSLGLQFGTSLIEILLIWWLSQLIYSHLEMTSWKKKVNNFTVIYHNPILMNIPPQVNFQWTEVINLKDSTKEES